MIDAAIVGLGRWGRSFVESVQGKSGRIRFVRGVETNPDPARAFARQHGFELSTSLEEALADRAVQAVVLATPHSLHRSQVIAAAKAGKQGFCEKPLALTAA
ncbi:MAG: Gfo/Idh/MocA family oxidoreductase, partial [Betaproteobacteria bacterium]